MMWENVSRKEEPDMKPNGGVGGGGGGNSPLTGGGGGGCVQKGGDFSLRQA